MPGVQGITLAPSPNEFKCPKTARGVEERTVQSESAHLFRRTRKTGE